MKAYSYRRWSSERQTKGDSLSRQTEITRNIAKQHAWDLDESLKPAMGISAFKGDNLEKGSLAQFLNDVNGGRIKTPCVLIVEQLDRLTRTRLRDARKLFEGLLERGVNICTAHNGKIYTDKSLDEPMDLFMSLMELKAANEYSANLGRRVAAARQRNRDAAASPERKRWTAMCPFWLTLDKGKNEFIVNKNAATIKRIFQSYVNGKGLRRIVIELNNEKIPAARKQWTSVHVRRVLMNRAVLGEYQPMTGTGNGPKKAACEPILNYYPAIIEKPAFYKVQERLKGNKAPGRSDDKVTNIFKGRVKCQHCGGSMVIKWMGNKKRGQRYIPNLVCWNAWNGGDCDRTQIRYGYIERAVLTTFWQSIIPAMGDGDNKAEKLIGLQGDLKLTRDKMAQLQELLIENPSKTLAKSAEALDAKEKQLTKEIEETTALLDSNPLGEWRQVPETTDNRLRLQAILANAIEGIAIDTKGRKATLTLKDADRTPVWLAWDAIVSNASRVKPADHHFYLGSAKMPYRDRQLVWKDAANANLEAVRAHYGIRPVKYRNAKGEMQQAIVATQNVSAA